MTNLAPFDIWVRNSWANQEVAGEEYHEAGWRSLLPRTLPQNGLELHERAVLLREPRNRFDRNAVSVEIGGRQVGYLPAEDAGRYRQILDHLASHGWSVRTAARLWASPHIQYDFSEDDVRRVDSGRVHCTINVALPEPHLLIPMNSPPQLAHSMLPMGSSVMVKGADTPAPVFESVLNAYGEAWVHVTLDELQEQLPRSVRDVIQVRINDESVGQLTPAMSKNFLPIVRTLADQGRLCAARAMIRGNRLKVDVRLFATQASELREEWLLEHANHAIVTRTTPQQTREPQAGNLKTVDPSQRPTASDSPVAGVAGWFSDPQGIAPLRFWDGVSWTGRIRMQ